MTPFEPEKELLSWYDRAGRSLPWRRDRDPYRVWVSEVMLQQTRVETVIPYFEKFLERFPDAATLAAASDDQVLTEWQGLGYYSRARHLHQGVREVVQHYGGIVPSEPAVLRKLPGIGAYTAGALLSIAHNLPEPAVDGNVLRVFSRFLLIAEPVETVKVRKRIEVFVREMLERSERRGDFTQALMELGALVCVPRSPRCSDCPWEGGCKARKQGLQLELPQKKTPSPPRIVNVFTGILVVDGRVLVEKRPPQGILKGMWQFPSAELEAGDGKSALADVFAKMGVAVEVGEPLWQLQHIFSHRQWNLQVFRCKLNQFIETPPYAAELRRLEQDDFKPVIWAGPHRKLAGWLATAMGEDQSLIQQREG